MPISNERPLPIKGDKRLSLTRRAPNGQSTTVREPEFLCDLARAQRLIDRDQVEIGTWLGPDEAGKFEDSKL